MPGIRDYSKPDNGPCHISYMILLRKWRDTDLFPPLTQMEARILRFNIQPSGSRDSEQPWTELGRNNVDNSLTDTEISGRWQSAFNNSQKATKVKSAKCLPLRQSSEVVPGRLLFNANASSPNKMLFGMDGNPFQAASMYDASTDAVIHNYTSIYLQHLFTSILYQPHSLHLTMALSLVSLTEHLEKHSPAIPFGRWAKRKDIEAWNSGKEPEEPSPTPRRPRSVWRDLAPKKSNPYGLEGARPGPIPPQVPDPSIWTSKSTPRDRDQGFYYKNLSQINYNNKVSATRQTLQNLKFIELDYDKCAGKIVQTRVDRLSIKEDRARMLRTLSLVDAEEIQEFDTETARLIEKNHSVEEGIYKDWDSAISKGNKLISSFEAVFGENLFPDGRDNDATWATARDALRRGEEREGRVRTLDAAREGERVESTPPLPGLVLVPKGPMPIAVLEVFFPLVPIDDEDTVDDGYLADDEDSGEDEYLAVDGYLADDEDSGEDESPADSIYLSEEEAYGAGREERFED
ncbi:hypothetical protein M011DRAFT_498907 [Sporormia fimetaria CBS 119925]|uniref:Uncharacterized protein n=1 Tax=Sporormia fimetaria CBS 119925 TaxID=1340428 RepID=A0A6A6VNV7_9PLEO|nr:hypothetical protein M011DRAFT_498907 [Sporormia fimetaria CBS 119925]